MWTKPWTMKEGFLIGGCLVVAGLILEMSVGPMVWKVLAWPINGIVLVCFLAMIALLFLTRKKVYAFRFIGTYHAAIPALIYAVALTIIMGLTRQEPDGTWLNQMLTFWPFVLIYVYVTIILGFVTLKRLFEWSNGYIRNIAFLLNHLGIFLVFLTATLGNADIQRVKMMIAVGESEWQASASDGLIKEMPFTIKLKRFIMETYDDGSPKRFASDIQILASSGKHIETVIDVNKPYEVDGWKIYQYGYDTQMGADSQMSVFELVRDPWLPFVYAGIYMMLSGAVLLVVYTRWRFKRLLPIGMFVAVSLGCVTYLIPIIRSTQLVPALQSPWFTPHILAYIICYSLMGVAAIIAIYTLIRSLINPQISVPSVLDNLVYIGLIFMTFGMIFGAFWAKEAWGTYWSWDPKETWAAITWFAYLVYIHYRHLPHHQVRLSLWILILSFVLLQMCWWGINYLPSAQQTSVHTYNM